MTDSRDLPPFGGPGDGPTEALTRRSLRGAAPEPGRPVKPAPAEAGGLRGLIARHPIAWIASAASVAFLLLATGAVFAGIAAGSGNRPAAAQSSTDAVPPRPQPSAFPAGNLLRTCSIAEAAADPRLGTLSASIVNVATGEALFDRNAATPQSPASVMMVLTAAAATKALGPGTQLTTKVVAGSTPGTVVLVGGGDPTLSTTPNSFYDGAPLMADLASAAVDKYDELYPGVEITQVVLDATYWDSADDWDDSWPASLRSDGYQPFITALMVNGDRRDPTASVSPRGSDPIAAAGEAFAAAAGLGDVTFSRGSAIGSTVLAEVKSQPISTLVEQMLETNDNTLAEMLARAVSKATGSNGGSASLNQVIPGALAELEIPEASTLTVKDGSGESPLNAVPPLYFAHLMAKLQAGASDLGGVYSAMPSSGALVATSGVIANERSLTGVVTAGDGTPLAFAFYAIGEGTSSRDSSGALEALAEAAGACGNNLSNN